MRELRKDDELVQNALTCFQSWLCGVGLTSPGVCADEDILAQELARLEGLKARVTAALATVACSERIRAVLAEGLPEGRLHAALEAPPELLCAQDLRRIEAALDVYLDEHAGAGLMFGLSGDRIVACAAASDAPASGALDAVVIARAADGSC